VTVGLLAALAWAVSTAAAAAARPPAPLSPPDARSFATAAEAVTAVLAEGEGPPAIVAFGEYHQTLATAKIPSALHRFTVDIFPALKVRMSHLVVETWMTDGRCGEAERAVTADVEKTTERPAATENEIETLLRAAVAAQVTPRILSVSCADYEAMRGAAGVDYDKTLRLTARALQLAILRALGDARRAGRAGATAAGTATATAGAAAATVVAPRGFVAVYGGALHNDVAPAAELAPYSFAPAVGAAVLGRYVEVDLVVPEYVRASAAVRAQPWWRAYTRAHAPRGATVLVRQSARSYVVVFPAASSRPPRPR